MGAGGILENVDALRSAATFDDDENETSADMYERLYINKERPTEEDIEFFEDMTAKYVDPDTTSELEADTQKHTEVDQEFGPHRTAPLKTLPHKVQELLSDIQNMESDAFVLYLALLSDDDALRAQHHDMLGLIHESQFKAMRKYYDDTPRKEIEDYFLDILYPS